jgi:hypothetical protein
VNVPDVILHNDIPVAIIIRGDVKVDNLEFFTEPDNFLQVGLHQRPKGMVLEPHVHKMEKPVIITEIQEVLLILSGSIKLSCFTSDGIFLDSRILKTNDSVVLLREGHQIEYLEETRMFEVKQGPYPGFKNAKIYLKNTTNHDTGK